MIELLYELYGKRGYFNNIMFKIGNEYRPYSRQKAICHLQDKSTRDQIHQSAT